jgi:hypothetical protein
MIPFVTDEGTFGAGAWAGYLPIGFPRAPWTLTAYMQLTQVQAAEWADWLNQVSDERQTAA